VVHLKRDFLDLLLGIGFLAVGLVILLFTFSQALALATNPGPFLQDQLPDSQPGARGPTASFDWNGLGLDISFTDRSTQGDAQITSWDWNFGDGGTSNTQNPTHTFASPSSWQVSLIVRDANGEESRAFGQVTVAPSQPSSGVSMGDPTAGLNVDLSFGDILLPIAVTMLTFGLYVVMAIVGGMITKAGWNLVKPKPETIRVRLKPKDLTQAFQEDTAAMAAAAQAQAAPLPPPPKA